MVSEAQSREAPVQRLADIVAGWFCYGVMSASAATFLFWNSLGKLFLFNLLDLSCYASNELLTNFLFVAQVQLGTRRLLML